VVIYRKATLFDAERLAYIRSVFLVELNDVTSEHERSLLESANLSYFKNAFVDGSFVAWIAIDGKEIVATSGLSFSLVPPSFNCPDGKVAYIMNMYTSPNYRGQGIGTELLRRIVEEAQRCGYRKITLKATDMGESLYKKYGFKAVHGDMVFYTA
jgi:GNAT superfamily N-acetyltransferase